MDSKKRKLDDNSLADLSSDDVRALLEPFSKEQLIDILQEAAIEHDDLLEEIRMLASKDPAHRKLFVRGLGRDISTEALEKAFSQYGEIEECNVIMDKNSGKSKGYGFVTFKHLDGALRALKEPSKKIEGRMSVCQLAASGSLSTQSLPSQEVASRKIYVGNVPLDFSADKLISVFSKYGEIEEGPLGFDKQTGKCKGFALFIYKSLDSVKRILDDPVKTVDGHRLVCKLADSQKQKNSSVQPDAVELALGQPGIVGPAPGIVNSSSLSGLLPLTQGVLSQQSLNSALAQGLLSGLNPNTGLSSLNASFHPSVAQQLALNSPFGSSLNPSLNSSLSASLNGSLSQGASQGFSSAYGQVPSSVGLASYGLHGLGVYGSQVAGLGSSGSVGASLYGMPTSSILQGTGGQLGQSSGARGQSLSSYFTT